MVIITLMNATNGGHCDGIVCIIFFVFLITFILHNLYIFSHFRYRLYAYTTS